MEERQIETARGTVHYWYSCPPQPRGTLVLLHGLTADHTLFERQFPAFADQWRLLSWDAPAHGRSRPYREFSYTDAVRVLEDILSRENIEHAVFIGQSMGGFIIQLLLRNAPWLADGFVAIDTCPMDISYYSRSDRFWLRQVGWMGMCYPLSTLKKAMSRACGYTAPAYENMMKTLAPYGKRELCRLMDIGMGQIVSELGEMVIPCPTLLLVGEHDKTGKVMEYNKKWHKDRRFPLHIIPNAAHNANYDNPEAVNAFIAAFLDEVVT